MQKTELINILNQWGKERRAFLFMIDFEQESAFASPLSEIDPDNILFDFQGFTNAPNGYGEIDISFQKHPISFEEYQRRFDKVMTHLNRGDSFLTNLTIRTEIRTTATLKKLFFIARAKYKILFKNEFLVFSPEPFVRIEDGRIYSTPMKGTIDASQPNARDIILNDQKEFCEHVTIVDLIRNDISRCATQVEVSRFRYVEELKTKDKTLLQVSSEITGKLESDYLGRLGNILGVLLPAGSVSGAPKTSTLKIIREAELEKRGYYTGVCGYFDGTKLDSFVMIRFIESVGGNLFYRSGGGITTQSSAEKEYQEAIEKIYVPIN